MRALRLRRFGDWPLRGKMAPLLAVGARRVAVGHRAGVPARLKQVLYSYVSNALKFTPPDGRVVIRARADGPDRFCLEVEDTGIGIHPEARPSSSSSSTSSTPRRGSGTPARGSASR